MGDVVEVVLRFDPTAASAPGVRVVRAVARPFFGCAPGASADGRLWWPIELIGDRWCAELVSDRPVAGPVELTGRFFVDIGWTGAEHPTAVRGRVRRIRLVEQRIESEPGGGLRVVDGSARSSAVEATPQHFWSNWSDSSAVDPWVATGVLLELDLDDVPLPQRRFTAGAVAVHECDVWVMDRSDPVLLHVDISHTPAVVTEFLVPLTIEAPTAAWTRVLHADRNGCWITSQYEVFRCDRSEHNAVRIERVTTGGGRSVVDGGRLFLCTFPRPILRIDQRYGVVRVEPDPYPVRRLDEDGQLVPVEDAALAARISARKSRPDVAESADGTRWVAAGDLVAVRPDGTGERIDLETRAAGVVEWVRSDPMTDPRNADVITVLAFPEPDEQ
ncbi:Uncharacterised protein [Rhodococcus gordoniae]|uniref:Uncharacterized protein n=1 Tax=Rhodococcus gordoniae TaxID=223392 RepID=A0A379PR17_9NOCA|nr:Uncharacterised protein [Rhodococcus gordoniae]